MSDKETTEQEQIELGYCGDCDRELPLEDLDTVGGDKLVCDKCKARYRECDDCDALTHESELASVGYNGDREVCEHCGDEYDRCDRCDDRYRDLNRVTVNGSRECICDDCECELETCEGCGYLTTGYGDCCEPQDDEDDSGYGYDTFYATAREQRKPNPSRLHIGWELEVELNGVSESSAWSTMREPWLRRNYDGSLHAGIEIVSCPMTYNFLVEQRDLLTNKLNALRKLGVRSYNTTTCGMHVHLSRQAFSPYHLLKFMQLVYGDVAFTTKLSQRHSDKLEMWASLDAEGGRTAQSRARMLIRKAKSGNNQSNNKGRYVAVNLENRSTVELRIFRGNLKPESFFKNIEYCVAAYHYTKSAAMGDVTTPKFAAWVVRNKKDFPNLAQWLTANQPEQIEVGA